MNKKDLFLEIYEIDIFNFQNDDIYKKIPYSKNFKIIKLKKVSFPRLIYILTIRLMQFVIVEMSMDINY